MNFLDLIWLIPLFPAAGFVINGLLGKRMSKTAVGVIGCGGHHRHALLLGKPDGPLLRLPDGPLHGIVAAVVLERVREVAVVRDVEVVRPSPNERAHHGLGEEEAVGVAGLDSGDPHVWRDPNNADPVGGRGNSAGRVGAVAVVVVCRHLARYRSSAQAVDTVSTIHVLSKVRVPVVETRVDVTNQHRRTAAGNSMRLRCMDLAHVPLQRG